MIIGKVKFPHKSKTCISNVSTFFITQVARGAGWMRCIISFTLTKLVLTLTRTHLSFSTYLQILFQIFRTTIITQRKRSWVQNHECIIVHSLIGDLPHSFPVWCEIWLDNLIDIGFLISRSFSNQIKVTEFSNSLTRTPPPPPPPQF